MRRDLILIVMLAMCLFPVVWLRADDGRTTPPDPFTFRWEPFGPKFDNPLFVTHAGDGSGRLFVVEQAGYIWILERDPRGEYTQRETPFLDINARVTEDTQRGGYTERGLLGLAFHPDYEQNGQFFVYYFTQQNTTALARYRVRPDDPNVADPASEAILLTIPQPYPDHNGGMIAFGPDGYLYVGVGDGGGNQGDPDNNAQRLDTLLGKLLRIDVNGESDGRPYRIPPDNPFVGRTDARPEIWALGLRNPWRFSVDRQTGDLLIGDVGWAGAEEINLIPAGVAGANLGWSRYEGFALLKSEIPEPANLMAPILAYDHLQGCSVTGGYRYRGRTMPTLRGVYLYGDYCNGRMWMAWQNPSGGWESKVFKETLRNISSFGEDEAGELYLVDYKGYLLRLKPM